MRLVALVSSVLLVGTQVTRSN